jgi:hypothetical protein
MESQSPAIAVREITDPVEIAESRERMAHFERNYQWLAAHASEVFAHRGKHICIAAQELFVGDDVKDLLRQARAAHPEDSGPLFRYIPKERAARIYAHRRSVACL